MKFTSALPFALSLLVTVAAPGDADDHPADTAPVPPIVTVQTAALKRLTLHQYIQGYGTVEPSPATTNAPAADALVSAPVAGVVKKIDAVEGQSVKQGDALMEINSGTLTVENATQQLERQKTLYATQNTSLKNLQDAEMQLALLRTAAPLSGTVMHVNVRPGQAVDLTTVVVEIMDLNRLSVTSQIPEREAAKLKIGSAVELLTDPPVNTEISHLSPTLDKAAGTVALRAPLPKGQTWRPGQFLRLRITVASHTNCLAAPEESVVTGENGQSSIALVQGGAAKQVPVKTGLRENGWVEVAAPELKPGDTIVTVGAYGLPDKTKIRVEPSAP